MKTIMSFPSLILKKLLYLESCNLEYNFVSTVPNIFRKMGWERSVVSSLYAKPLLNGSTANVALTLSMSRTLQTIRFIPKIKISKVIFH